MLFLQDYFHDKKHRFCAKKKELILSEKLLKNLLFFQLPFFISWRSWLTERRIFSSFSHSSFIRFSAERIVA